jgi:hypothetical protein
MRKLVLALFVLAVCGGLIGAAQASSSPAPLSPKNAPAAAGGPVVQSPSPQFATNTVFFSNVGPGGSFSSTAWCVSGATSPCGRFDEAMPFFPSVSGLVTQIYVGLVNVSGTNAALVQLAQDNGGVPGAILASGGIAGSPHIGATCCVGSISVSPSVPIGYGHRYWIIVRPAASNTYSGWNWSYYGGSTTFAFPGRDDVGEHVRADQLVRSGRLFEALQGLVEQRQG